MAQQTECIQVCQNCSRSFPQSKISTHIGYCRRNIKRCNRCNELYDVNYVEEHEEQFHKQIVCKYCQCVFNEKERPQLESHENGCEKRTKYCQYCQLNVPSLEYERHFSICSARTKRCENCGKCVMNKEFYGHVLACQQEKANQQELAKFKQRTQNSKNQFDRKIDRRQVKQQSNNGLKNKLNQAKNEKSLLTSLTANQSATYSFINPQLKKKNNKQEYIFNNSKQQKSNTHENQSNGVKRPILNTLNKSKKEQQIKFTDKYHYGSPTSSTYSSSNSSGSNRNRVHPGFNPKDYMNSPYGNYYQDDIPQQVLLPQSKHEQQQIQKAILQSLALQQKISSTSTAVETTNLPKQFQDKQLLEQQFMQNFDIQKQIALYQEMEKQQKQKLAKLNKK